jgi:alpha-N-arabinofuranosidase
MNHADRVKVACLAQLVNVIGAIMTEPGGPAWRQTIFHPFAHASRFARGTVLRPVIDSPTYPAETFPEIPYLCACAVDDRDTGTTAVFALNRHLDEDMELRIELRGLGATRRLDQALTLWHRDLQVTNHRGAPDAVAPRDNPHVRVDGETIVARLPPASWNVLVTTAAGR